MRGLSLAHLFAVAACGGSSSPSPDAPSDPLAGTAELDVRVPANGSTYVSLAGPSLVTPNGSPTTSRDWDLAFSGYNIYTDSGVSGSGLGGAFGPFDLSVLGGSDAPTAPFISADKAGGAFLDWYAYDSTTHVLYSRYHVFGVKNGARLWKVQILTYYGIENSAPTSAYYQFRYADISSGVGTTQTLTIDGTAGGLSAPTTARSGCIDLASGTVSMLTVAEAQASTAWDLCFRRDQISVNGEIGGPRGDGAIDLEVSQTASEQLSTVESETADSEQPLFDGVDASAFAGMTLRGDHIVSAFETGAWTNTAQMPPTLVPNQAWLVVDASGQHQYLVALSAFQNATAASPGTVVIHIKPVTGGST